MSRSIVLLHGWAYRPSLWQTLADEFPERRLLAPNLMPEGETLADWTDALSSTLPETSLLVGWSLGSMLALCLARRHPERVAGMLLIGATPCFVAGESWNHGLDAEVVARFQTDFARSPERTLKRFLALQVLGEQDRTRLSSHLETHLAQGPEYQGLAAGLRLLAESDLRDSLPGDARPCLLLHGQNDALMPVSAARFLHEHLSGSRLRIEPNSGHAPLFTQPAALAALIREVERELG